MSRFKPLSGNSLISELKRQFDIQDFSNIRHKNGFVNHNVEIHLIWCEKINALIDFMKNNIRLSNPTAYHDCIKYFINKFFLNNAARLEIRWFGRSIDLVLGRETHEVKTIEFVLKSVFVASVKNVMRKAGKRRSGKKIWWICFLHQAKTIKGRVCVNFLGFVRMSAETIKEVKRAKGEDQLISEIVSKVESIEQEIIEEEQITQEELDNMHLFGVENAIVAKLRQEVFSLQQKAEKAEKKAEKAEKKAEKAEKKAEKAEKKAEKAEKKAEKAEQEKQRLEKENQELQNKIRQLQEKNEINEKNKNKK